MFKREFKVNLKGLLIWLLIGSGLYAIIYLIYPLLITDSNFSMYDELLKAMDPNILKVFNMDISSISHVSGWLYSEGMMILTIFMALYTAILGSNILLKEEDDKTIEYLYSKPITKNQIVTTKILVGIINIVIFNIVIFLVNLIGLYLSDDLVFSKLLVISSVQVLTIIPLYLCCVFFSTLFRKTKNSTMVCIGFVFLNYFLNIISLLGEKVSFVKYFSLFTLSNYRDYLLNGSFSMINVLVAILLSAFFGYFTYFVYNRKEFL